MTTARRFVQSIQGTTKSVLITIALVSAFFTCAGVMFSLYDSDNWLDRAPAVVLGIGVFSLIYIFWTYAIGIVPRLKSGTNRVAATGLVIVSCVLILALSSWFNVTALGGREAMNLDIKEIVTDAETALERANARTAAVRGLFPRLRQTESWLGKREEAERLNGESTGTGRKGPVSNTYLQARDSYRFLLESVEGELESAEELHAQGLVFLEEARAASSDLSIGPRRRLEDVSRAISALNGVLGQLAALDLLESVRLGVEAVPATLVVPVNVRTSGQQEVIVRIIAMLKQRAAVVSEQVRAIDARSPPATPVLIVRRNPMLSVARHYQNLLPAWAAGISLDLMPLTLLLFTAIAAKDARSSVAQESFLEQMSGPEFLAAVQFFGQLNVSDRRQTNGQESESPQDLGDWPAVVNGNHHWNAPVLNGDGREFDLHATWESNPR